jgi:hypothetical protein
MRLKLLLSSCLVAVFTGCQTAQLRESTVCQSRSVTDVYYDQILDNIAMLADHGDKLPYFSLPNSGQTATQYSISMNYTTNLDLLAANSTLARYVGKFIFDKHTAAVTGGDTNIEQWNTKPTCDPDQILLMKFAYEAIFGTMTHYPSLALVLNPKGTGDFATEKNVAPTPAQRQALVKNAAEAIGDLKKLKVPRLKIVLLDRGIGDTWVLTETETASLYDQAKLTQAEREEMNHWLQYQMPVEAHNRLIARGQADVAEILLNRENPIRQFQPDYTQMLHTGWFAVGKRCDVPKDARYIGHCGDTYAWVLPGQEQGLADFALVILDITSYQPPSRTPGSNPSPALGKASTR